MKSTLTNTKKDILDIEFFDRFEKQLKADIKKYGWKEIPKNSKKSKELDEYIDKCIEDELNEGK